MAKRTTKTTFPTKDKLEIILVVMAILMSIMTRGGRQTFPASTEKRMKT